MKKLAILSLILFNSATWANKSTRIWKSYFPDANCSKYECAKRVPSEALEQMLEKASYHTPNSLNYTWAFVADFTINSRNHRGWLINLKTGNTRSYHVSHGVNSGDGNGNTIRFSNRNMSKQSSVGLYTTAETYYGKHGYSLRMDGHESTNSNARARAIVIHGASYIPNSNKKVARRIGRSWGCPAVASSLSKDLIDKLKGGSVYYIHGE